MKKGSKIFYRKTWIFLLLDHRDAQFKRPNKGILIICQNEKERRQNYCQIESKFF